MLDPNNRSLLTDALTPPAGTEFEHGLATTYSLDPEMLLTIPLYLGKLAYQEEDIHKYKIQLFESIRRVSDKFKVFYEKGRMHLPSRSNRLYGLLEPMLEACSIGKGAFHSKVMLLSFKPLDQSKPKQLRLLVMSRNLTFDSSWDVLVRLDGSVGKTTNSKNKHLKQLFSSLYDESSGIKTQNGSKPEYFDKLMNDLDSCHWELPNGVKRYKFHLLPLASGKPWALPKSAKLAVISPFLGEGALKKLHLGTDDFTFLISRSEELDKTELPGSLKGNTYVLADDFESSDLNDERAKLKGLHAKAYFLEKDNKTHVFLGSANATNPVFSKSLHRNSEFMVELAFKQTGMIKELKESLSENQFIQEYQPREAEPENNNAEQQLEAAFRWLRYLNLQISYQKLDNRWQATLKVDLPVDLQEESFSKLNKENITIKFYLLSKEGGASKIIKLSELETTKTIELSQSLEIYEITGLLGIELKIELENEKPATKKFCLEVPFAGDELPAFEDRQAAILKSLVSKKEDFMHYLHILLADSTDPSWTQALARHASSHRANTNRSHNLELPLFEKIVSIYATEPERLKPAIDLMKKLNQEENEEIAKDLQLLWPALKDALGSKK